MMSTTENVATPSHEYDEHCEHWTLPRTLMGGTRAMRKAREKYLPREKGEVDADYNARLGRSVLFNAFRKTVKDMTDKVFRKEVQFGKDVPDVLRKQAENIDLAGRHLNVFARDVFFDGLQTGINYLLVDMPPKVTRLDGSPGTLADEQKAGVRPYIVHVKAENLIGWISTTIDGIETLTQVRIRECVTEPSGRWSEKEVEQIRVLEPGRWEVWRKKKDQNGTELDEWEIHSEGTTSLSYIPFVPVYINRHEFMEGTPPLEDLADLNVAHWQSASDQRNILHFARVPILFGAGFTEDTPFVIGGGAMIRSSDPNAKLVYVEHSGSAIEAGAKDQEQLEFQMQTQGLMLLTPQPGGKTATGELHDDDKENSALGMMVAALQDALEAAFGMMAEYQGLGKNAGGSIDVNKDFGLTAAGAADLQFLLDAVNSGKMSIETFWSEVLRRGVFADSFDPEVEKSRIESASPELNGPPMNLDATPAAPAAQGA